jgi:hypothetical protein
VAKEKVVAGGIPANTLAFICQCQSAAPRQSSGVWSLDFGFRDVYKKIKIRKPLCWLIINKIRNTLKLKSKNLLGLY